MPQVSLPTLVAQALSGESLVSFPTDTVPALAVRPDRAELVFAAKQRNLDKPLILMAATIAELWSYVTGSPAERQHWQQLAEQYLPGALTLVLPANDRVPPTMNPMQPTTIGVRVPHHPLRSLFLLKRVPLPLLALIVRVNLLCSQWRKLRSPSRRSLLSCPQKWRLWCQLAIALPSPLV
jgi:L-threonylcarbamoyladenylate synthase